MFQVIIIIIGALMIVSACTGKNFVKSLKDNGEVLPKSKRTLFAVSGGILILAAIAMGFLPALI